jgi:hypothetical protein
VSADFIVWVCAMSERKTKFLLDLEDFKGEGAGGS